MIDQESVDLPNKGFTELMQDETLAVQLIEGSCLSGGTPQELIAAWEAERQFIAEAIHKAGTILDFGCANGLLLKSLQEWSEHDLNPYGLDVDEEAIRSAKRLFPDQSKQFATPNSLSDTEGADFPSGFDLVYWNVWDNYDLYSEEARMLIERLIERTNPGGRTIFGFYDTDGNNQQKIAIINELGHMPNGIIKNPHGTQRLAYFKKK